MSALDGRASVQERLEQVDAERDALLAVLAAYDHLEAVTQPGRGLAPSVPPVPVSQPEAAALPPGGEPPAQPWPCSACTFVGKSEHALRIHVARAHKAEEAPKVDRRKVTYLCSRNCGRSFDSKERVNQHETAGTCQPKPTPPPVDLRQRGMLAGMGQ